LPNPAVIKAAAALLSDERARKGIGWIIAAILSPLIVLLALLCSLSAGSGHNASVVELCFNGGTLPPDTPAEYAAYIEDMRSSLGLLDGFIEDINGMTEEEKSLDGTRVKAIFFALYFGADLSVPKDHQMFTDCFVTYDCLLYTSPSPRDS